MILMELNKRKEAREQGEWHNRGERGRPGAGQKCLLGHAKHPGFLNLMRKHRDFSRGMA